MVNKITICKDEGCKDMQVMQGFCRQHYIKNWRKIKEEECVKQGISFEEFIEKASEKIEQKTQQEKHKIEEAERAKELELMTKEATESHVIGMLAGYVSAFALKPEFFSQWVMFVAAITAMTKEENHQILPWQLLLPRLIPHRAKKLWGAP